MIGFLLFLFLISVIVSAVLWFMYASLKAQIPVRAQEQYQAWQRQAEADLQRQVNHRVREWCTREAQTIKAEAQRDAVAQAQTLFQTWREKEADTIRKEQKELASGEANTQLQQWKTEQEKLIRQDAIQRSQAVTVGKVTEHLVPYLPDFVYNPKDARFIGSPVDFIIFDGLNDEEGNVREVVFVEIKTGKSSLTPRERQVRNAIKECKVKWVELRVNREIQQTTPELLQS